MTKNRTPHAYFSSLLHFLLPCPTQFAILQLLLNPTLLFLHLDLLFVLDTSRALLLLKLLSLSSQLPHLILPFFPLPGLLHSVLFFALLFPNLPMPLFV